jgi:hypothetical protein
MIERAPVLADEIAKIIAARRAGAAPAAPAASVPQALPATLGAAPVETPAGVPGFTRDERLAAAIAAMEALEHERAK